jgi:serine/threonine-protein kinase
LPSELQGFNWGALILAPIWGVANTAWVVTPLFALWILPVPWPIGLPIYVVGSIFVGFQANEMAWRAKEWKSIEDFKRIQQSWAFWGFIASPIVMLGIITVPFGIWN